MIDEFITKVGDSIRGWFSGFFNLDWIPEIFFWYWWLFVLFLICGVIIWFFGWSKIVRIIASMAFLFGAIFVAGGHYMSRRLADRQAKIDARKRPAPRPTPQPQPQKWWWE